jgi:hypothetical protein
MLYNVSIGSFVTRKLVLVEWLEQRMDDRQSNFIGDRTIQASNFMVNLTPSSFFFGSKLLSRGEGLLEHRMSTTRLIDRGYKLRE